MLTLTLLFLTAAGTPMQRQFPVKREFCNTLAPQVFALSVLNEHPGWTFKGYACSAREERGA